MSTRNTLFQKPTVEIDQDRYEELVRHEMQYEQYKQCADENIRNISQSKALVDILQTGQYGITLRTYEALVNKKKLVTNNTQIKKYPFYAKENIFILGEDEISTLKTFIKMPFNDFYDFSIYMIENWITDFFQ